MNENRARNSKRNIVYGLWSRIITLFCPFIIRTIIIKELGSDYVGLSSLFTSILTVLNISELGFGSAMVYSMYKPISDGNAEKVCQLLGLYKRIYRRIGCIITIAGLALMPFLHLLIKGDYPGDINIYILYVVYLLNAAVGYFLFAYKGSLLSAMQREDINSKILGIINLVMYILQIGVLVLFKSYMGYIVLLPIATIIINVIKTIVVNKLYPQYSASDGLSKDEESVIYKNVMALFGHRISGTIISASDNIVISVILGLTAVATYGNYYYILNMLVGFYIVIISAIRPSVGNSIVSEFLEVNYRLFKSVVYSLLWVIGWCTICLVCLYQPFITLWLGLDFLLPMSTAIILGLYFYAWKILDTLVMFRDAAGMWWSDRYRPYIVSCLNLVGNIVLVYIWGLNGVVFATLFTSCAISIPWVIQLLFKEYFKRSPQEFIFGLVWRTAVVLIAGLLTYEITSVVSESSTWGFAIKAFVCITFPNCVFAYVFGRTQDVHTMIKKILPNKVYDLFRRIVFLQE